MRIHPFAGLSWRLFAAISLFLAALAWPAGHAAEPLAKPSGPVILTVTGAISQTNAPGRAEFDQKMLEALGFDRLTTSNDWTDGKPVFEGVLGRKLLDAVGAHGKTLSAIALNDYVVDIPADDFTAYPVLLAMRMNGQALTPRDKGPIWIVYPRDDYPALRDPKINDRWIWQLKAIDVK
jgi:hypothetical protein